MTFNNFSTVLELYSHEYTASEFLFTKQVHDLGLTDSLIDFFEIEVSDPVAVFIETIKELVDSKFFKALPFRSHSVLLFDDFCFWFQKHSLFSQKKQSVKIGLGGSIDRVTKVGLLIEEKYGLTNRDNVDWFYKTNSGFDHTKVNLVHRDSVPDSFYPWLKPSVADFQKSYLESDANVLLLMGVPGCGRSSFVRDMINRFNLSAAITYDEQLMGMDDFFVEFIKGDYDLLVLEDADTVLQDRTSGNKVMSKLLNASDGLVRTNKKIVMTANLTHLDQVDSALIRPGRCFDALIFRELHFKEAVQAAQDAGLPEPDGSKTLSELFQTRPSTKVQSRLGFSLP